VRDRGEKERVRERREGRRDGGRDGGTEGRREEREGERLRGATTKTEAGRKAAITAGQGRTTRRAYLSTRGAGDDAADPDTGLRDRRARGCVGDDTVATLLKFVVNVVLRLVIERDGVFAAGLRRVSAASELVSGCHEPTHQSKARPLTRGTPTDWATQPPHLGRRVCREVVALLHPTPVQRGLLGALPAASACTLHVVQHNPRELDPHPPPGHNHATHRQGKTTTRHHVAMQSRWEIVRGCVGARVSE
jgi:hypothetical protein